MKVILKVHFKIHKLFSSLYNIQIYILNIIKKVSKNQQNLTLV